MGPEKICFKWRQNRCKIGANCKFAHDEMLLQQCRDFQRPQGCARGLNCRFGHYNGAPRRQSQVQTDAPGEPSGRGAPTGQPPTTAGAAAATSAPLPTQKQSWERVARLNGPYRPPQMQLFVTGALKLLEDNDIQTSQEVVESLADRCQPGGKNLGHIQQLLEADFSYYSTPVEINFQDHVIPFLRIITHPKFRESIVTDRYAGMIFNVIYGPQGQTGIAFFDRLLARASTLMGQDPVLYSEVFSMIISALRSVIKLNSNSLVQDEIKRISRVALAQAKEQGLFQNSQLKPLHQDFKVINEELALGEQIPSMIPEKKQGTGGGSIFSNMAAWITGGGKGLAHPTMHPAVQAGFRLPGTLSDLGPRHDNDHANISDIRILPTAEEIRSLETEFLPKMGEEFEHLGRNDRLLDSKFRLLREDSIGGLRESLRQIIEHRSDLDSLQRGNRRTRSGVKRISSGGIPVLVHQHVRVEDLLFSDNHGLKISISFNQPLEFKTGRERVEWWRNEKVLEMNNLVCILNENNEAVFFTVSDRFVLRGDMRRTEREVYGEAQENGPVLTLAENVVRAGITLKYADAVREKDVEWLHRLAFSHDLTKHDLIEFPKTLLISFRPILQGLQKRIGQTQAIPFIDWLAPDPTTAYQQDFYDIKTVSVPPPHYANNQDFFFELSSISTTDVNRSLRLYPRAGHEFNLQHLLNNTTLDEGQANSLVKALCREIGLIQGPPGTGKSFVGTKLVKVLLDNRTKANLGPIICVCYTNHALDQFLEHLLDIGVENIIRLGSRSKSERLEPYMLRNLTQSAENTRLEKKEMWVLREKLRSLSTEATGHCNTLKNANSEKALELHIAENHPIYHQKLFSEAPDEHGFTVVRRGGGGFGAWRSAARPGPLVRPMRWILQTADPWNLTPEERFALLRKWEEEMVKDAMGGLSQVTADFNIASDQLSIVRKEWDRRTLQSAHVIGVTTTSLAVHADVLRRVQAKVLFCEEAGEILEAHTITTLIPSIEHMILIGDHEQLRPHIANYDLSIESKKGQVYSLDVSLFERLARQPYGNLALDFPIASLNTQRRMHPSIADLIRIKTYPKLEDNIPEYPSVPGMKKRLFWMNHSHPDSTGDAIRLSTSYTNEFEQEMVISMVAYLLQQGVFKPNQIAVLTPYLGQMSRLKKRLMNSFGIMADVGLLDQEALDIEAAAGVGGSDDGEIHGPVEPHKTSLVQKARLDTAVRIATVDNFQGEEAEVVIVSLVRSNKERKCGFLKTSNRINVLLSRAKWGMYLIGNAETAGSESMWRGVIDHLTINSCIGNAFELQCSRHPDVPIYVSSQDDFVKFAPEGGCSNRCEWRLECGHACVARCHARSLHQLSPCHEPCTKALVGCDHPCASKCGQVCAPCMAPIYNIILNCGHIVNEISCWQYQKLDQYFCKVKIEKEVPGCKHKLKIECGTNVKAPDFRCRAPCGELLGCGHSCKKICRQCRTTREGTVVIDHGTCTQLCERPFNTCSHICIKTCHGEASCGACEKPCEIRCVHSQCKGACKDPCPPCAESVCPLGCEHRKCLMPCGVSCNILPCNERCSKLLKCGHPCPSICGEVCPTEEFCRECASDKILDFQVDMLLFETYRESVDEPIIFLPCGHLYTVSTFDGVVDMRAYFEFASSESWEIVGRYNEDEALANLRKGNEKGTFEVPKCPHCRKPFTTSSRYNEVVKRAQLQNCIRRFTNSSQAELTSLQNAIEIQQDEFEASRPDFRATDVKRINSRYQNLNMILKQVNLYNKRVLAAEQPYHRVYELTTHACRNNNIRPDEYKPAIVQYRFGIEGTYLGLRARLLWYSDADIVAGSPQTPAEMKEQIKKDNAMSVRRLFANCDKLIDICRQRRSQLVEIQARIVKAKFGALVIKYSSQYKNKYELSATQTSEMQQIILKDLEECMDICEMIPSCGKLKEDVKAAITTLNQGVFMSTVSDREMKEVYEAMQRGFGSTGHWYTCPNGHPFTIGECGQAMQLGTCNECGAQIGGQDHRSVAGVVRTRDMDDRMRNLRLD